MKGKPIMISDAATTAFWPWLKAKFGFTDTQIRKYTFNAAPFIVDPKAIQEGYLSSEPFTIEQEGHFKPQVFLLADNGYPGYANMVLVPQKWIDDQSESGAGFRRRHDSRLDGLSLRRSGARECADQERQSRNDRRLAGPGDRQDEVVRHCDERRRPPLGLGSMTDARWKTFFETMSSEKTVRFQTALHGGL